MPLNPDQFHEHINQMEMGGVSFPGPGVVSVGGRAFPASRVEHLRHEGATPGGGDGWYTDIHLPDERHGPRDHLLMVNRADSASAPSSMIFHPAGLVRGATPNSGSMFWQADPPHPNDSRAKRGLVVNSSEEFIERLPEMIRNAPAGSEGERPTGGTRMRSPQPFHRVEVHELTQWSIDSAPVPMRSTREMISPTRFTEAHEYDPRSRSLTRDPENDYRP